MSKPTTTIVLVAVVSLLMGGGITFLLMFERGVLPSGILYEDLLKKNPPLSNYTQSTPCIAGLGAVNSYEEAAKTGSPRVNVLTFNKRAIGILSVWPASAGWFPYADQSKGFPIISGGVPAYTQRVFFEAPPTATDCASVNE